MQMSLIWGETIRIGSGTSNNGEKKENPVLDPNVK